MNGAEAVVATLANSGVSMCFANPGTSEMHLVAALDRAGAGAEWGRARSAGAGKAGWGRARSAGVGQAERGAGKSSSPHGMRAALCLFEGVATGAADGYGRMAGRPAAVLLHLGPGLANGLANLHNARRARTPVLVLAGDHAGYHKRFDAPLESDIEALAGTVSGWVRRCARSEDAGPDVAEAAAAAMAPPGRVATVILPADVTWSPGAEPAAAMPVRPPAGVPDEVIDPVAKVLRSGEPCVILLGGAGMRRPALEAASRLAGGTGARLLAETFPARHERGAGIPTAERLAYLAEMAAGQLAGTRHLILAGARAPASFFAYPGKPSSLVPDGCQLHVLATPGDDIPGALASLADLLAPGSGPSPQPAGRPGLPDGDLTGQSAAAVIGALLPEGAIVCDEANTSGLWLPAATAGAPPHDWLTLTGGAIGQGLPLAAGAALACPDRPVLALEADGSAMYTISALWTHAREQLDITTVIFSNRSYAILNMELERTGAPSGGQTARDLLDLSRPGLNFAALAEGMGVPASRAGTAADLAAQLRRALAEPGPHLIEATVPPFS